MNKLGTAHVDAIRLAQNIRGWTIFQENIRFSDETFGRNCVVFLIKIGIMYIA